MMRVVVDNTLPTPLCVGDPVSFKADPTNPLRPPGSTRGVVTSVGARLVSVRPDGSDFAYLFEPSELTLCPPDETTAQGMQPVLAGTGRSARQAAAARNAAGHGKIRPRAAQLPPGGLFEPAERRHPDLFDPNGRYRALEPKP